MKNKIIFICTGYCCRSQIAEGLFRNEADKKFEVFSAGSHPSRLHPAAIKVMTEWGIDIQKQRSEKIDKYLNKGIKDILYNTDIKINYYILRLYFPINCICESESDRLVSGYMSHKSPKDIHI